MQRVEPTSNQPSATKEMRLNVYISLMVMAFLPLLSLSVAAGNDLQSYEIPRTQVVPIADPETGSMYELYIKLPATYADRSERTYPTLYFTDALWHFEILSASTEYLLEDVILVGLSWQKNIQTGDVPHISRFRDYSIRQSKNPEHQAKYQFGQADRHLAFFRDHVIKYVEEYYRTDPTNRSYFGYSLGGVFGAYVLLTQPDTFKNYILGSPSLAGDMPYLGDLARHSTSQGPDTNVFISYGSLEQELGGHADALVTLLDESKGDQVNLKHTIVEGNHQTAFPMTGVGSITWLSHIIRDAAVIDPDTAFRDIPLLNHAITDATPAALNDNMPVGVLGIDGGDKDAILQLATEIAEQQHDHFDSLLIAHKDKLIFESYYLRGRSHLPHPQASTTKVYTALAIGRAIQLGHLTMADLHKPLVSFLHELDPTTFVDGVEKITLHKAMTMRSGIRIDAKKLEELAKSPNKLQGQAQVQAYLSYSAPITDQTQTFLYQSIDPTLVMQVLEAVVPGSAKDFIKGKLLNKLGIDVYRWHDDISGLPTGAFGSSMRSRDMVKWGILALNKGVWQGEQLIPADFIAQATRNLTQPSEDTLVTTDGVSGTAYGYYWWLDDLTVGNKRYLSQSAQGGGGQYIILVEALDLVVVVTAHNRSFHHETLSLLANRILPGFIQQASIQNQ